MPSHLSPWRPTRSTFATERSSPKHSRLSHSSHAHSRLDVVERGGGLRKGSLRARAQELVALALSTQGARVVVSDIHQESDRGGFESDPQLTTAARRTK